MKNVNLKLVGAFASLIASLIFLVCSKFSKVCVLFACIFMAICLVLMAIFKQEQWQKTLKATDEDLAENSVEDDELLEIEKLKKKYSKKQKRMQVVLYVCAFLLVIAGIWAIV